MGNDGHRVVEGLPSPLTIKVHVRMYSDLLNLVVRVSKIIPEIEAARPRASGIEALCSLNNGIAKAKCLLQYCSESSILYLVLTGDAILSRCNRSMNLMEHSLSQIQNMVPVMLGAKISGIIFTLRSASFCLDPPEEEAGKVLRELLHRCGSTFDSTEEFALSSLRAVCSWFHISSRKALVIEKRCIRKLLDKCGETERSKRKILSFFLSLLNKYGNIITEEQRSEHEDPLPFASPYESSGELISNESQNSIASLGSSMNDLNLPLDFDNLSSLPSNQCADPTRSKIFDNVKPSQETHAEFCEHPSDSSCRHVVEDVRRLLKISDESWSMMPFGKFVQLLIRYLKDARDLHDVEAQITGCLYLLELVQKNRNSSISYMKEDAYGLLASFLDTEVAKQALSILEVLSLDQHCHYKIAASGSLVPILNILENQVQEMSESALNILSNLSINSYINSFITPSELIPKIIPLLENSTLARYCLTILKNLSGNRDSIVSIAETDNCVPSIIKLLDNGIREEQEHAVSILLSLCSQRVKYRQLVMDEAISGLVDVSINGTEKAKAMATELMRILLR